MKNAGKILGLWIGGATLIFFVSTFSFSSQSTFSQAGDIVVPQETEKK
jgi:hypothetical protein